jgi:hypothetical protein
VCGGDGNPSTPLPERGGLRNYPFADVRKWSLTSDSVRFRMAQPTAQGLPASPPAAPQPPPGFVTPLPLPKKKHGPLYWIAVVIGVIVIIVIVVVIASTLAVVSSKVDVTGVNFDYGANHCPAHEPASAPGFTSSRGATVKVTTTFVGPSGNGSCQFGATSVEQSGFTITGSNSPLVVDAGQSATGWFDVQMPDTSYDGNLTISILVEACGPNGEPPCI